MTAQVRLTRGDTWQRTWIITDDTGNPVNLTGATARLHCRAADSSLVIEASTSNGRLTITPMSGRIDLVVPYSVTETVPPGGYMFDLEVTHANGVRRTYESGTLIVVGDVTYG